MRAPLNLVTRGRPHLQRERFLPLAPDLQPIDHCCVSSGESTDACAADLVHSDHFAIPMPSRSGRGPMDRIARSKRRLTTATVAQVSLATLPSLDHLQMMDSYALSANSTENGQDQPGALAGTLDIFRSATRHELEH